MRGRRERPKPHQAKPILRPWMSSRFELKLGRIEEIRMKIYVGNLSYEVTEEDLQQAFKAFGQVTSVNIIKDIPESDILENKLLLRIKR